MTQQPKTFPEDLELYYLHIVHNHALTFESFLLLLYLQHGLTNYNYIYPISKHCFQKTFEKCKKQYHKTCTALQNHV